MSQGILAMVSSTGCSQASALQSLSDSLHIPHLHVQRSMDDAPRTDCLLTHTGYTLSMRPSSHLADVALRAITDFHWQRFLIFYDSSFDLRGLQLFLDEATRRGLSVSLQRVDSTVSSLLAGLFSSLPTEQLNRFRDLLRRAMLLLSPRNAKAFISQVYSSLNNYAQITLP
uniref:Receptor ligand binding region domain-containing protein n=1 Tax=Eptatretus burgeri TaxID=7764 RepID=A0A8C4QJX5_EPTBU